MKKNSLALMWLSLSWVGVVIIGYIDWITGYDLSFFEFFFLPVSVAAWFIGFGASIATAFLSAMVWFGADFLSGHLHSSHFSAVWNTTNRLASFLIIGWAVSKIRELLDREQKLVEKLQESLAEIKILEGFLPICCECKKIRNQEGHWEQMEAYISKRTGTTFSHGYCPQCFRKVMAEANLIDEHDEHRPDPDHPADQDS